MSAQTTAANSLFVAGDLDSRYRQLVQSLPVAIYTCDANGHVKLYNQASIDLWGREPEIGKDLWCGSWKIYTTTGLPLPLDSCPMAVALREARPVYGEEIVIERPDGTKRNVLPHPRPIFDSEGKVVEAVNMLVDVTDQRRKEKVEKKKLEAIVQKRTKELKKMNVALGRSNDELEQYAYIASHDLQEPLRKIQTFANLISMRHADTLEDDAKVSLDKIINSASRMTKLINDLLSFSRLSENGQAFEQTDLNDVFNKVINDFEIRIKQKNATITNKGLPIIEAIPLQVGQLFHNLVSNSLKFSGDALPVITVSSRLLFSDEIKRNSRLDPKQQYIEILFSDNGIGFDQEYGEKIFSLFSRLNGRTFTEGSGIGLAICRKIVTKHQGDMYARSQENHGASFYILLPVHQKGS